MHYIRFLKQPRAHPTLQRKLSAKVTITTDLGESFLAIDLVLIVALEVDNVIIQSCRKEFLWQGSEGMRSLEIVIPVDKNLKLAKVLVRAKEDKYAMDSFQAIAQSVTTALNEDEGGVVTLRSLEVNTITGEAQKHGGMVERVFHSLSKDIPARVHIWEEMGESIARHIWDAGLIFSSYLAQLASHSPSKCTLPPLPILTKLFTGRNLNIIELGAGCGIVSITLATFFSRHISHLLLTDLHEASAILSHNTAHFTTLHHRSPAQVKLHDLAISSSVLDWSLPLPIAAQGRRKWDLVLVADCTYNPDVVPDLVRTFARIRDESPEVLVCVAMKVRHESESVFFHLMARDSWAVREETRLPLPVLGGEDEEIELYVFGSGEHA